MYPKSELSRQNSSYRLFVIPFVVFTVGIMLRGFGSNDDNAANRILEKVISTYQSMPTYKATGIVTSEMDFGKGNRESATEFSIMLQKPNKYLIHWTEVNSGKKEMRPSGAVWSNGIQAYLYMGPMNTYSKIMTDETAISSATKISKGVASTVPMLFLTVFEKYPNRFFKLNNLKIEKTEIIDNEECYVISGTSITSNKVLYWISKSRYLILKYYRSIERPVGGFSRSESTEEELEKGLVALGLKPSVENKNKMRDMMKRTSDRLDKTKIKGFSTEIHHDISSPELTKEDFDYILPTGATLDNSMFERALNRQN
ncbi:MAG: DUF2092 domain-containing protein [Candidatus Marinimicrobia bacterium]|nr:DUF2092 domain-containing protein [Candidatus Neomarinimicrobiota bacterium]MBL7047446.1 DUF2092 domain-containing protein [Candidatus Neomarinimicrobiota bacterium]